MTTGSSRILLARPQFQTNVIASTGAYPISLGLHPSTNGCAHFAWRLPDPDGDETWSVAQYGHCGIALVESGNCHSGYDRSLRDAETGALTSLTSTAGTHPVNYQNMSLNTQDRRRPRHPPAHASHFFPFFFPFPGALLLLFDSLMLNPPLINASRPTALIIRNRSGPR